MTNIPYQLPIDKLLNKLQKVTVKKTNKEGLNQWQALCPAHTDKTPSLTITECLDNTVLIKCWSGCIALEIVASIGLELKDLFKYQPITHKNTYHPPIKKLPSKQAITHEKLIITIAQANLNKGQPLNSTDHQRYQTALQRLKRLSHVK